jgi:hypothetical protein
MQAKNTIQLNTAHFIIDSKSWYQFFTYFYSLVTTILGKRRSLKRNRNNNKYLTITKSVSEIILKVPFERYSNLKTKSIVIYDLYDHKRPDKCNKTVKVHIYIIIHVLYCIFQVSKIPRNFVTMHKEERKRC